MSSIRDIIEAIRDMPADLPAALATVVRVEGSTFRRPGARMLVFGDGRRIGSVSGGCLEADVVERARQVMRSGKPAYALYDTRDGYVDALFELGCRGAVGVLIEPVSAAIRSLELIEECRKARQPGAIATVFDSEIAEVQIGDRILLFPDCRITSDIGHDGVAAELTAALRAVAKGERAESRVIQSNVARIEAFVEPILPPVALLIVGSGDDAAALARTATSLGWDLSVADHRASAMNPERTQQLQGVRVVESLSDGSSPDVPLDSRTAAVLMTHNVSRDLAALHHLIASPISYLGLVGPRRRGIELIQILADEGVGLDAGSNVFSPAGLDIGAESPEEIALSIISEIQAVMAGRTGGSLRNRCGPIHERGTQGISNPLDAL